METKQAIEILIQVANAAQKAGVFSLKDAVTVAQAVEVLTLKEETKNEIS